MTNIQNQEENSYVNEIDVERKIINFIHNISKQYKATFISTFIWGIIAHGMALFNKYSFHDDIGALFSVGGTYNLGRWLLGVLGEFISKFFGSSLYSIPLINGLCSILFIAISACIIIDLFEIRHIVFCISLSGIMVTFPVITGLFGYMYTAPYYMFGLLLTVTGAFLVCKYDKWYSFFGGVFLICCSMGIYQAFVPVAISTFLLYLIQSIFVSDDLNENKFFKKALYYAAACIVSVLLYFLLNNIFLQLNNSGLSNYMGIDMMGKESIGTYLFRMGYAFKKMLLPSNMCPGNIRYLYMIWFLIMGMLTVELVYHMFKKNIWIGIQLSVLLVCLPIAINLIYIMSDVVHTLMVYGQIMFFVYSIWILEYVGLFYAKRIKNIVYSVGAIGLLLFSVMYCRFDNICYLKAEFVQQKMISYYTTLITQIKSVDDYKDELPVTFVNSGSIQDQSIPNIEEFNDITILPYVGTMLNDYTWIAFMRNWCGYSPVIIDSDAFDNLPEVQAMPSYPDAGSIQVVNETVVIKF